MADVPVVSTAGQLMELANVFQQAHLENKQEARLTQAATAIDRADGSVPAYTRTWIRALDGWSTEAVDEAFLIWLAKQTATGDLLEEIRQWTSAEHDGISTWPDLRKKVLKHFLSACETLKLQAQLEHAKKKERETISAYIRRYRAEATRAYPEERPTSEERHVVASVLRGFAERTFAERLFCTGKVTTLIEAISTALEKEAERESLEQVLQIKGQETMEVDVVKKTTMSEETKMTSMMETMQRRLEQLNARLARVEASRNQQSLPKSPRAEVNSTANRPCRRRTSEPDRRQPVQCNCLHQWTPDGRSICGFCRQPGHFYHECQKWLPGTAASLTLSGGQK